VIPISHISLIKIKIKNPNRELLKKTIMELAKEMDGSVTNTVRDFYGNTHSVILGVKNKVFTFGIGVNINENGEVEVVGDFYRVSQHEIEEFQQKLIQRYTSNALQLALIQLGFQTQTQKLQDKIVVRAWSM
jgi:hypothetical protein